MFWAAEKGLQNRYSCDQDFLNHDNNNLQPDSTVTPTIGIATPQTNAFSLKPINGATAGIIGTKNRLPILISDILE